jgi:hypothetical protein
LFIDFRNSRLKIFPKVTNKIYNSKQYIFRLCPGYYLIAHQLQLDLLFDFGQLELEKWNFDGPITKLIYKNMYDRVHSIQPVLLSFEDTPYSYSLDSEGFRLEMDGKIYDFKYLNGELVYTQH